MAIQPVAEVQTALKYVDAFRNCTDVAALENTGAYGTVMLLCSDSDLLSDLLLELARELAGADWVEEDDNFFEDCLAANVDYWELLTTPNVRTPAQQEDLQRKEFGDLGELLALLYLLTYTNHDPSQIFPKNALKLYERVSEPGIDVLVFALDLSEKDAPYGLLDDETAHLVECKCSPKESFSALATLARNSLRELDLHRWQRELKVARASYKSRGAPAVARRLKGFLLAFKSSPGVVQSIPCLVSTQSIPKPFHATSFNDLHTIFLTSGLLASLDVISLCTSTFGFRR